MASTNVVTFAEAMNAFLLYLKSQNEQLYRRGVWKPENRVGSGYPLDGVLREAALSYCRVIG